MVAKKISARNVNTAVTIQPNGSSFRMEKIAASAESLLSMDITSSWPDNCKKLPKLPKIIKNNAQPNEPQTNEPPTILAMVRALRYSSDENTNRWRECKPPSPVKNSPVSGEACIFVTVHASKRLEPCGHLNEV